MAESHTQTQRDLTELLTNPPKSVEEYWPMVGKLDACLGAQAILLTRAQATEYAGWIEAVESTYDSDTTLSSTNPDWLKEQVRISPINSDISVNLIDYNTVVTHLASEGVQSAQDNQKKRRAAANRAYAGIGALNYADDLGIYLAPVYTSMLGLRPTPASMAGHDSLEDWSLNVILDADKQKTRGARTGMPNIAGLATRALFTNRQPGRLNFSSSALLEMGAYFIDFDEIPSQNIEEIVDDIEFDIEDLAENSLAIARRSLSPQYIGEYPFVETINTAVADQLLALRHDIEFMDIYRRARFDLDDYGPLEGEYVARQVDYIQEFKNWMIQRPGQEGIGYEWLTTAVLRHYIFENGLIGEAYARRSTVREDEPEDRLKGCKDSQVQAHDVFMKHGLNRWVYQCKRNNSQLNYANPIFMLKARKALGVHEQYPKMMKYYRKHANELERYYLEGKKLSGSYRQFEAFVLEGLTANT